MVDIGGIPRPASASGPGQELADLRRRVEQLTSARTFVSIGNIVEGGTIGSNVGEALTETVKDRIIIDGENLAEDALNDKVIVGSSVRSEGVARAVFGDGTTQVSNVSATLEQRVTPWSVGEKDTWPGLWLEGVPEDEPGWVPPALAAGVTLGDAWGGILAARSARQTEAAAYSEMTVSPSWLNLNTYSAATEATGGARSQTHLGLGLGRFNLTASDVGARVGAEVRHDGDGYLRLNALNGVLVNGAPIGSGAPAPLVLTSLTGSDQPSLPENDVAIIWTGAAGDTAQWGNNYSPKVPTRLYAQKAGLYFLTGNVTFSDTGGGMRGVWFRKNGTKRIRGQSNPPPSAQQYAEIDAHNYEVMAAGDYIEIMATVAGAAGAVSIKANEGTAGALEWKRPA